MGRVRVKVRTRIRVNVRLRVTFQDGEEGSGHVNQSVQVNVQTPRI